MKHNLLTVGRRGLLWLGLILTVAATITVQAAAPLRVLLFSGRNNHDWQQTTPHIQQVLEDSGRFKVDICNDPAKVDAKMLADYDVLFSNWSAWPDLTGRQWGETAEKAVMDFVQQGKGFVLVHAASATFHDWPEYMIMVGSTWDKSRTGHGKIHAFKVHLTDAQNPVTKGMPDFWIRDELWHQLGLQTRISVLATAFSSKDNGGSGADEPVALCTEQGKGRCFNLVLGHDAQTMRNVAWQTFLKRGVEWAATSQVTIPIPGNWPSTQNELIVADPHPEGLKISLEEDSLLISQGDRVQLKYHYQNVPFKPYVQELYTPKGLNVVRDAPHDHLHHHGLMYAVRVNGTNFWEESPIGGKQVHRSFSGMKIVKVNSMDWACVEEKLDWIMPDGKETVLKETRTLAVPQWGAFPANMVIWQSRFDTLPGQPSVEIAGAHYFGMGMRFITEMDERGSFLNANDNPGTIFRGAEQLFESDWCAYSADKAIHPVTVAMFASKTNRRQPPMWFTMNQPFAYLSAAPNLHVQPIIIQPGTPWIERNAVVLWDGPAPKDQIQNVYGNWTSLPLESLGF